MSIPVPGSSPRWAAWSRKDERRKKRRAGTEMSARVTAWGEEAKASAGSPVPIFSYYIITPLLRRTTGEARGEIGPPPQLLLSAA